MDAVQIEHGPNGVARITMNRPERFNAFDEAMIAELTAAFEAAAGDPAVRVLLLAGAGDKAFSAGADVQWMRRAAEASQDWNVADARRFAGMLAALAACPKPTVARVHGLALGGGVGLICACDIAIAAPTAQFAVSEARLGLLPAVIAPYLVNAVGLRQARRLGLTAGRIGAAEALQIGLVQQVADDLDGAVERCITELLASGPQAQAELKALFAHLEVGPITAQVRELGAETIARVRRGDEAREGFAAFLAKRSAAWIPKENNNE